MADTPVSMPRYPGHPPAFPGAAAPVEEEPTASVDVPPSRLSRWLKSAAWTFLTIFLLIFFTLTKLPDDRLKNLIQGNLATILAARGITMTVGESHIGFLFGVHYVMKNVTLNFPPPDAPAQIEELDITPSVLPMLFGKMGATVTIKNGKGSLGFSGGMRGSRVSGSLRADQFDIGKIGLLKLLTDIGGSAVVTGKADFDLSTDDFTTTDASIQLDLSRILVNSQSVQGFMIPALSMSQGQVDLEIEHGKGQLKALKLGKADSPNDDIKANISGDLTFGKALATSTCNLKANFSLSESLLKSFVLLDALLAQGKQPDGSYAYRLEGPLLSPNPIPVGAH